MPPHEVDVKLLFVVRRPAFDQGLRLIGLLAIAGIEENRRLVAGDEHAVVEGIAEVVFELLCVEAVVQGSGRVGRSAAGRALDEHAVMLAVIASMRHQDTGYDELLMAGVPRGEARARVRPDIDRILAAWQDP